jgi:DNA-binding MarR family transcriptional regulator
MDIAFCEDAEQNFNVQDEELLLCYCANLRWVTRKIDEYYLSKIGESGISSIPFYSVLYALKRKDFRTTEELAAILHLDRTTLVRKLKLMNKKGLISFFRNANSAMKSVYMTEHGKKTFETAFLAWKECQAKIDSIVEPHERKVFEDVLKKLAHLNQIA